MAFGPGNRHLPSLRAQLKYHSPQGETQPFCEEGVLFRPRGHRARAVCSPLAKIPGLFSSILCCSILAGSILF